MKERINIKVFAEGVLGLPLTIVLAMIENTDPRIPHLGYGAGLRKVSDNPTSWTISAAASKAILYRFERMTPKQREAVAEVQKQLIAGSEKRKIPRKLGVYFGKNIRLIGRVQRIGGFYRPNGELQKTVCVETLRDYDDGVLYADHVWCLFTPNNANQIKIGDFIKFEGTPYRYSKPVPGTIGTRREYGIGRIKELRVISKNEVFEWKDNLTRK